MLDVHVFAVGTPTLSRLAHDTRVVGDATGISDNVSAEDYAFDRVLHSQMIAASFRHD